MKRYLTIVNYVDYGDIPGQEFYGRIPVFGELEILAYDDNIAFFIASTCYRYFELAEVAEDKGFPSDLKFLSLVSGYVDFNMN